MQNVQKVNADLCRCHFVFVAFFVFVFVCVLYLYLYKNVQKVNADLCRCHFVRSLSFNIQWKLWHKNWKFVTANVNKRFLSSTYLSLTKLPPTLFYHILAAKKDKYRGKNFPRQKHVLIGNKLDMRPVYIQEQHTPPSASRFIFS